MSMTDNQRNLKLRADARRVKLKEAGYVGVDGVSDRLLDNVIKSPRSIKRATEYVKETGKKTHYIKELERIGLKLPAEVEKAVDNKSLSTEKRKKRKEDARKKWKSTSKRGRKATEAYVLRKNKNPTEEDMHAGVDEIRYKLFQRLQKGLDAHSDISYDNISYRWGAKSMNTTESDIIGMYKGLNDTQILWLYNMYVNGRYIAETIVYDSESPGTTRYLGSIYRLTKEAGNVDDDGVSPQYGGMGEEDLKDEFDSLDGVGLGDEILEDEGDE